MEYACIGSGSSGNAAVIRHADSLFLLDCGLTIKETVRRLAQLQLTPDDLQGIVVTHEHGDHLGGVAPLARRYKLPVWVTHGTWQRARDTRVDTVHFYCADTPFHIGAIELRPFAVPHDAAEACQFVFAAEGQELAVLTDLGSITPHVVDYVQSVQALVLECNHDETMLRDGPYPPALQARVGGRYGHLSNRQAAALLTSLDSDALEFILLAHLSEQNNSIDKAIEACATVLKDGAARLAVLPAAECSEWFGLPRQSVLASLSS